MSWLPDWLTGYDAENAKRAEAADAALREMNAEDALAYGPTWLAQAEANYAAQDAAGAFNTEAQRQQIDQAFAEGFAEGLKATQERWKSWLNNIGLGVLGFIPWWAWVLAVGWLAWKLGALDWLKRRIARA